MKTKLQEENETMQEFYGQNDYKSSYLSQFATKAFFNDEEESDEEKLQGEDILAKFKDYYQTVK